MFTAVKRKKATSLPVFQSFEVWMSLNVYEREVRMKTMHNMSRQTENLATQRVQDSYFILNTCSM